MRRCLLLVRASIGYPFQRSLNQCQFLKADRNSSLDVSGKGDFPTHIYFRVYWSERAAGQFSGKVKYGDTAIKSKGEGGMKKMSAIIYISMMN